MVQSAAVLGLEAARGVGTASPRGFVPGHPLYNDKRGCSPPCRHPLPKMAPRSAPKKQPYLILRYAAAPKTSTTTTMTVAVMATMLPVGKGAIRKGSAQQSPNPHRHPHPTVWLCDGPTNITNILLLPPLPQHHRSSIEKGFPLTILSAQVFGVPRTLLQAGWDPSLLLLQYGD